MIFLRKLVSNHHSLTSLTVKIPKLVAKQLDVIPGDDLMFEFQPGAKEIVLTKSQFDRLPGQPDKRFWTKEEIELLKTLCKDGITKEIAARFGRSKKDVRTKARRCGFVYKRLNIHKPWSAHEKYLLMELYPDTSDQELTKRLGRTIVAIKDKAKKLGLRKEK